MGVRKAEKEEGEEEEEGSESLPPLWLRLEYNEVEEPQTLVDDWKSRELTVSVYSKAPSRHHLSKGVHLPYFLSQGKPTGYVHGEDAVKEPKWKEQWKEAAPEKKAEHKLKWKLNVKKDETEEK